MNNFNTLLNTISVLDFEPDKAIVLLEYLIKYRDAQVNEFNRVAYALEDVGQRIDELNAENEALTKKVGELERALADAKAAQKPTITMNLGRMMDKSEGLNDKIITYTEWVRSDGVEFSDDQLLGLYEAKYIAEYIFVYFNYKDDMSSYPSRGERYKEINWDSDRDDLKQCIEWLLEYNYPGYAVVWA